MVSNRVETLGRHGLSDVCWSCERWQEQQDDGSGPNTGIRQGSGHDEAVCVCSAEGAHCSNLTNTISVFIWLPSAPQERRLSEGFWTAQVETLRSVAALTGPGNEQRWENKLVARAHHLILLFNLLSQVFVHMVFEKMLPDLYLWHSSALFRVGLMLWICELARWKPVIQ